MTSQNSMIKVTFEQMPEMFPYSEEGSFYLLKICGKPVAEYVIESLQRRFPTADLLFEINDKYLQEDERLTNYLSSLSSQISADQGQLQQIKGNRIYSVENGILESSMPWHILSMMAYIVAQQKASRSPTLEIEDGVQIDGNVHLSQGVKICHGAILDGDIYLGSDCMIGYNAVLRGPCVIEQGCRIGYGVEVKNALIQSRTFVGPLSFIADSVLGEDCFLGALTRTSNFRLDQKSIHVLTQRGLVDTGLDKLGCFMGRHVHTGVGVIVLPGRKIGNHVQVGPQVIVKNNLASNKRFFVEQKVVWEENI